VSKKVFLEKSYSVNETPDGSQYAKHQKKTNGQIWRVYMSALMLLVRRFQIYHSLYCRFCYS